MRHSKYNLKILYKYFDIFPAVLYLLKRSEKQKLYKYLVHKYSMSNINPNSIDREASRAFKKVKYDIEELRKLVHNKQDKQHNVLVEMNNMKSELKIEFREELLELQKSMNKEIESLRKEVLYYRDLCEKNRYDHHKVKVVEKHSQTNNAENTTNYTNNQNEEFHYKRIVNEEPKYQPTPKSQNFEDGEVKNKSYLKWITVGDADLDSIDEVYVR